MPKMSKITINAKNHRKSTKMPKTQKSLKMPKMSPITRDAENHQKCQKITKITKMLKMAKMQILRAFQLPAWVLRPERPTGMKDEVGAPN